ncbi:MAG: hypothetical protein IPM50_13465 [Acidobacteriota bacterium]|nr:MAG: hypothetical protein IPM50_13465 [Acidobacteriota bacterium]
MGAAYYGRDIEYQLRCRFVRLNFNRPLPQAVLTGPWAQHITGEILNTNGGAVLCG